jgi:hypothetical protein
MVFSTELGFWPIFVKTSDFFFLGGGGGGVGEVETPTLPPLGSPLEHCDCEIFELAK